MRCHSSSTLSEMVISLTGNASLPSSIQNPEAPREKSPVTALNPKPIMSVTYRPRFVEATMSAAFVLVGMRRKLLVDGPDAAVPPARRVPRRRAPQLARAVAVAEIRAQDPFSTTRFFRAESPSPSNGRDPGRARDQRIVHDRHQIAGHARPLTPDEVARLSPDRAARNAPRHHPEDGARRVRIEHHRRLAGRHLARAQLAQRAPRRLLPDLFGRAPDPRGTASPTSGTRAASSALVIGHRRHHQRPIRPRVPAAEPAARAPARTRLPSARTWLHRCS